MHNKYISYIVKTLIILLVLMSGYYFLYFSPNKDLPDAYIDSKKLIETNKAALIKNILPYIEITTLDPNSSLFLYEKSRVLDAITSSNKYAINSIKKSKKPSFLIGIPTSALITYNFRIITQFDRLNAESLNILQNQQSNIKSLVEIDSTLNNIFNYVPNDDLGNQEAQQNRDEIVNKVSVDKRGFTTVLDNLGKLKSSTSEIADLKDNITKELKVLDEISADLQNNNYLQADANIETFITNYSELKKRAYNAELSVIRNQGSIKNLTDLTNIIIKLDNLSVLIKSGLKEATP